MKITFLFLLAFAHSCVAQDSLSESFIGVHYTGLAYDPEYNDVRPWNSGFGLTSQLGLTPHFAIEVGWDKVFVQETHGKTDTITHSIYTSPVSKYSFRVCVGEAREKWSAQLFVGVGLTGYGTVRHKKFYADHAPVTHNHNGSGFFIPQMGVRAMWHLSQHISIYTTVIGTIRFNHDEFTGGHYPGPKTYYEPMKARGFFWANAGIAYRGMFDAEQRR